MERRRFKVIYSIGVFIMTLIRLPYWRRSRTMRIVVDRKTAREKSLLAFLSVGTGVLPLVYIFTPWLNFANYTLRSWVGWMGAGIFGLGLAVFWRAHAALGPYWSDSLQLREGQPLITNGIYRSIRHPMYAFGWLLGIAQGLLLQNWIAGPSGLVSFGLLYFSRVRREEQMLLDQFGDEYRSYMQRTGRIIPRLKSGFGDRERP